MSESFTWDESLESTRIVVSFDGDSDVTESDAREAIEGLFDNDDETGETDSPRQFSRGYQC